MRRRALALLAAASLVAMVGGGGGTTASAATGHPEISLSPSAVAPGQRLTIMGSGWPIGTRITASICGAEAVSGSADCAQTSTIPMGTDLPTGRLFGRMTVVLPPRPCPCVVLVTGTNLNYSQTFPVTVLGAPTAPVTPLPQTNVPHLQIQDLQVLGGMTLASSLGGSAPRTVEFRVYNAGSASETPFLLGRWGKGTNVDHVIEMPVMKALGPGKSAVVQAHFSLPALSIGRYTVKVEAKVVGFGGMASASASTSTWPIALFVIVLLLLGLLAFGIAHLVRRRRRRRSAEEDSHAGEQEPSGTVQAPSPSSSVL